MSNVKIEGNASGTGTFTIAAPNSNTDRTLTLPDEAGTVLTSASNTNFPAGSVLQVVSVTTDTVTSTTGSTYIATTLSASITPTRTTSKILVLATPHIRIYNNSSQSADGYVGLTKDSGSTFLIEKRTYFYDYGASGIAGSGGFSMSYLDSPATTSSITYTAYIKKTSGNDIRLNDTSTESTMTLMEIAA